MAIYDESTGAHLHPKCHIGNLGFLWTPRNGNLDPWDFLEHLYHSPVWQCRMWFSSTEECVTDIAVLFCLNFLAPEITSGAASYLQDNSWRDKYSSWFNRVWYLKTKIQKSTAQFQISQVFQKNVWMCNSTAYIKILMLIMSCCKHRMAFVIAMDNIVVLYYQQDFENNCETNLELMIH